MGNPTRSGTVYTSRNLTRHYAGAVASVVVGAVLLAIVAVTAFTSLLGWLLS